jgi:photosystem II stability/assembly factor-like uncharacterized protein
MPPSDKANMKKIICFLYICSFQILAQQQFIFYNDVSVINNNVWVSGHERPQPYQAIIMKIDEDRSHQIFAFPFLQSIDNIFAVNDSTVFAAARHDTLLKTTNYGADWEVSFIHDMRINSIQFINDSIGYVAGNKTFFNESSIPWIFKTNDRGATWDTLYSGDLFYPEDLYFINEDTGWVVGEKVGGSYVRGVIFHTTDGGLSWHEQMNVLFSPLLDIKFLPNGVGYVVGWHEKIIKTTDGGNSWTLLTPDFPFHDDWNSIAVINDSTFFVGSDQGNLKLTTNSSSSYKTLLSDDSIRSIGRVARLNEDTVIVAASDETTDYLKPIYYFNIQEVITFIKDNKNIKTPDHFNLSQNFPNPFNPSTKIRFSLAEKSFATLKVFNILGKEIAVLINEELPAGIHEVEWNASALWGLSSGVYFYNLTSGNFSKTKKLLLLR